MVDVGEIHRQRIPHIHIGGDCGGLDTDTAMLGVARNDRTDSILIFTRFAVGVHHAIVAVDNDIGRRASIFGNDPRLTVG